MSDELEQLRTSLLRTLRVPLEPEKGDEAFERHQLLASRFHRAARLNSPGAGDRKGWETYFGEHLPARREHALLLFEKWRCALLKDEMPGRGIVITHGQPETHWLQTDQGLCINLESMWDDFEASVVKFVALLQSDQERRERVLKSFREKRWTVQPVTASMMEHLPLRPNSPFRSYATLRTFSASATGSETTTVSETTPTPPEKQPE